MSYCVVRTDKPSGEAQMADMISLNFYTTSGSGNNITYTPAQVENGVIVELKGLDVDASSNAKHEIYRAVAATSSSDLNNCAIVCSPEVMYDERIHGLDKFINPANKPCRGYILRSRNIYSWTADGFVSGTAPTTIGSAIGIGTGGKLATSVSSGATTLGTYIDTDVAGRYTYYTVEIGKTELAGS